MLWYGNKFTPRFNLRLNEARRIWYVRDFENRRWEAPDENVYGTNFGAVRFSEDASKMFVQSLTGYPQRLLVFSLKTERVLAHFHVSTVGAITITSGNATPIDELPREWKSQMILAVGVEEVFTMNITDILGDDEDVLRHKIGKDRMYLPSRYADGKATVAYDTNPTFVAQNANRLRIRRQTDMFQSCSSVNTVGIDQPAADTMSNDASTPAIQQEKEADATIDEKSGQSTSNEPSNGMVETPTTSTEPPNVTSVNETQPKADQ